MEMKPGLMLWKGFKKMTVGFMGFISLSPVSLGSDAGTPSWDREMCRVLWLPVRGDLNPSALSPPETNDILQHRCFKKNNKLKALRRAQLQGQDPLSESILGLKAPQLFVG